MGLCRQSFTVAAAAVTTALLAACTGGSSTASKPSGVPASPLSAQATTIDTAAIDAALGRTGTKMAGDVYRVSFPRADLRVVKNGVVLKPGFALGGYLAFRSQGGMTLMVGDTALTEDEVAPVSAELQRDGIEITALHNHLVGEAPSVKFLHVKAMGDAVQMAQAVHRVYALTGTPPPAPVSPPAAPTPTAPSATPAGLGIDTAGIDAALGHAGKAEGGVYKLTVARAETITDMGMTEPAAMGVATVINFQPTGGGQAAVTGDFALLDSEVQGVEATLRGAGLEVTALHAHMLTETPHLAYLHFFAVDDAVKLARSLGAALAKTNSAKG